MCTVILVNLHLFTDLQEVVAIGELRLVHFSEIDLAEVKHEINVLKYNQLIQLFKTSN